MKSKKNRYDGLFNKPLDEIKEDIFFRPDNFKDEKWYGDFQMFLAIGTCTPAKECLSEVQKALKIMGFLTHPKEYDGKIFLVSGREAEKPTVTRKRQDLER